MNKSCFLFFLSIIIFLNFSCRKTDITPAFLVLTVEDFQDRIDNNLSEFNRIHDTSYDQEEFDIIRQQNFTDVLVSLNGKQLGYWNLPCRIPLLPDYSGNNNIRIIPCVRIPNTTLTTVPYHFLKPVEVFLDIEKEGEYRFPNLKFEYVPSVAFPMLETFEQGTRFASLDSIYGARMEVSQSMGRIFLSDSLPYFNVATSYFHLVGQENGQRIQQFWEMRYMCDGEMTTYFNYIDPISGITYAQDMIVLPSTKGSWKKVYIDLSNEIAWAARGASRVSVRLGIRGNRNSNSGSAYFYFDHIKLISMRAPY